MGDRKIQKSRPDPQYQLSNIAEGNDKAFLLSHFLTILRKLGWKPKTSLEEGIKTTYEWYVSTREAKQTR